MMKLLPLFWLISLLFLPLEAVKKDTKLILEELAKVNEMLISVDRKISQFQADLQEVKRKLETVQAQVNALAVNNADLSQNREQFQTSLQILKEELNQIKNNLSELLSQRLPASKEAAASDTSSSTEGFSSANDPSTFYYAAYSDYIKENYNLAIEGFRQFVKKYPESTLADNALYWIGECYYAQKKYQEAIQAYNEVLEKYKNEDKVAAALLKKGYSLINIGRQSDGIMILRDLISRFPLSEEASLAQQKLKELEN